MEDIGFAVAITAIIMGLCGYYYGFRDGIQKKCWKDKR